jgi:hypothetical protein
MNLTLIKNPDESKIILYKLTRIIYAETGASSLSAVEALASMTANLCVAQRRDFVDIACDDNIFESLNTHSARHDALMVDAARKDFQMCLRVVQRMMNGTLPDRCSGATKFHRTEHLPNWAVARGSIMEIDNLLFYL